MMRRFFMPALPAAILLAALFAGESPAAGPAGAIRGTVTDPDGRPVYSAEILLLGGDRGALSDRGGRFVLRGVPPGTAAVRITHIAYRPVTLEGIVVGPGDTAGVGAVRLEYRFFDAGEIEVAADRPGRSARDAATPINIVPKAVIAEREPRTTAEALREEPGITVQKTGHGGGSASIRGLSSNRVLLLVDGIRLNNSTYRLGNHQYLTTVDYRAAETIEVVRGPTSVLYGSDAMGGTIDVITRRPSFSRGGLRLDYGVSGRFAGADREKVTALSLSAGHRKVAFLGGVTLKEFGDLKRGASSVNPELERATNGTEQSPTGFDGYDIDMKAACRLTDRRTLTLAWQETRQRDVPRYDKYENNDYLRWLYEPQRRDLVYLLYEVGPRPGGITGMRASVSWHRQEEGRAIRESGESPLTKELDEVRTVGAQYELDVAAGGHFVQGGAEGYFDDVASARTIVDPASGAVTAGERGRYPDGSNYRSLGIFVQDRYRFRPRWTAVAGLRGSWFEAGFENYADAEPGRRIEQDFDALTASGGLVFAPAAGAAISANVAQAFRAPNLSDLTKLGESKGNVYEIPNSGLEPEKLVSYDLGARWERERFGAELSLWQSSITDIISSADTTLDGEQIVEIGGEPHEIKTRKNIGEGFLRGFDASAELSVGGGVRLAGYVSYSYGRNETLDEPYDGVPPLTGLFRVEWRRGETYVTPFVRWAAKQNRLSADDSDDPRIPEGGTPSWYALHLRAGFPVGRHARIRLGVENILDRNYREHGSGVNGPGRGFVVGIGLGGRGPSG